jgi:hypothetical protein
MDVARRAGIAPTGAFEAAGANLVAMRHKAFIKDRTRFHIDPG